MYKREITCIAIFDVNLSPHDNVTPEIQWLSISPRAVAARATLAPLLQ